MLIRVSQGFPPSINRSVAAGCEIDKVTSAFAIFIAKLNLPMAVGDEFGLLFLAKKMFADSETAKKFSSGRTKMTRS